MWQTLERKARFVSQVATGMVGDREVEEIDEQVLSYAEVKALATGDPRIMEKAAVDSDIGRLTRLQRTYHDEQRQLEGAREQALASAAKAQDRAELLAAVVGRITSTSGDRFAMTVAGRRLTSRSEAGVALRAELATRLAATPPETAIEHPGVAELAGLTVDAQTTTVIEDEARLLIPGTKIDLRLLAGELRSLDPGMLVQRLERRIHNLPQALDTLRAEEADAAAQAERAASLLGRPWKHADELNHLLRRQRELDEALTRAAAPPAPSPPAVPGDADAEPEPAAAAQVKRHLDALETTVGVRPDGRGLPGPI